jgi:uncharacterized membrane protein
MLSSLLRVPLWLRPSDSDRERTIESLKHHYAEGRLSAGEFEARVERTLHSSGGVQLGLQMLEVPLRALGMVIGWRLRRLQRALIRVHFAAYASLNVTAVGIWALTGEGSFWPALLLLPTTVLLIWHLFASRGLTRALRRRGL